MKGRVKESPEEREPASPGVPERTPRESGRAPGASAEASARRAKKRTREPMSFNVLISFLSSCFLLLNSRVPCGNKNENDEWTIYLSEGFFEGKKRNSI